MAASKPTLSFDPAPYPGHGLGALSWSLGCCPLEVSTFTPTLCPPRIRRILGSSLYLPAVLWGLATFVAFPHNQLSRCSMGISPLATAFRRILLYPPLGLSGLTSRRAMARSQRFVYHGRHQVRSSYACSAWPPPWTRTPLIQKVGFRGAHSGSVSLLIEVLFHLSLTVLVRYRYECTQELR